MLTHVIMPAPMDCLWCFYGLDFVACMGWPLWCLYGLVSVVPLCVCLYARFYATSMGHYTWTSFRVTSSSSAVSLVSSFERCGAPFCGNSVEPSSAGDVLVVSLSGQAARQQASGHGTVAEPDVGAPSATHISRLQDQGSAHPVPTLLQN